MVNVAAVKYPLNIPGIDPNDIIRIEGPDSKWAKLICRWKKKIQTPEGMEIVPKKLKTVINCKTEKVYLGDSKKVIAAKFSELSLATPVFMTVKTIYHLFFPLSLPYQIYITMHEMKKLEALAVKKGQEPPPRDLASRVARVILRNFIDIVKTPLYMVAMTVVAVSTLILAAIKPQILYEGRVLYGEMLMSLNWGEKKTLWTLALCMQPLADLKNENEKKFQYVADDIEYNAPSGTKLHALNNMARNEDQSRVPDFCPCLDE